MRRRHPSLRSFKLWGEGEAVQINRRRRPRRYLSSVHHHRDHRAGPVTGELPVETLESAQLADVLGNVLAEPFQDREVHSLPTASRPRLDHVATRIALRYRTHLLSHRMLTPRAK